MDSSESSNGSEAKSKRCEYRCVRYLQDNDRPVYGGAFNLIDSRYHELFATAGDNRVTVYHCLKNGQMSIVQAYVDEDREENFFTVCWMSTKDGQLLLAAGGLKGIIRIINVKEKTVKWSLVGHGNSVNDLRAHPSKPWMLISASKDESIRLWNVESGICISVLAGSNGHRHEVLSADFHPADEFKVASSGMDATIRIWSLKCIEDSIYLSETWNKSPSSFKTRYIEYPVFITEDVHSNYIDCVRWYGDFLISKSVDDECVLWRYCPSAEDVMLEGFIDVLEKYPVPECDIWFIKFSLDMSFSFIATGNRDGKCFVYDLDKFPPEKPIKLQHQNCKSPIRQTAISADKSTIICCCEDGKIWRWDALTNK